MNEVFAASREDGVAYAARFMVWICGAAYLARDSTLSAMGILSGTLCTITTTQSRT
jgi:hypothetical protein